MKIEVDLNKKYLFFFGIIIVFALMGGVLAVVGHSVNEINWGSGPVSIGSITSGQWVQLGNVVVQGELLVANGTNGLGIGRGQNLPRYALDVNGSIYATGTICSGSICLTSGGTTGGLGQWINAPNGISYNGNVGIGYANPEARTGEGDLSVGGKAIINQGILTSIISVSPETNEDYMNINTNSILVDVNGNVNARKYCINGTNCIDTWPSGTTTTPGTMTTTPYFVSTTVNTVSGTDYGVAKEFTVNFRGWVVINSSLKVDTSGTSVTAYSRVCKNSPPFAMAIATLLLDAANCGPEHSTTSTSYVYNKDAIAVSPGDKIQLYLKSSHAAPYSASSDLLKTETIYSTPGLIIGGGTLSTQTSYPYRVCTPWGEAFCAGSLQSLYFNCPASVSTARVTGFSGTTTYYICVEN